MRVCFPFARYLRESVVNDVTAQPDALQVFAEEFESIKKSRELLRMNFPRGDVDTFLPCQLDRLIWNAQKLFSVNKREPSDLNPINVVKVPGRNQEKLCLVSFFLFFNLFLFGAPQQSVQDLVKKLMVVPGEDALSKEAQFNATICFTSLIRASLSARKVIMEHRLNSAAFEWVIGEVRSRCAWCQVMPFPNNEFFFHFLAPPPLLLLLLAPFRWKADSCRRRRIRARWSARWLRSRSASLPRR